MSVFAGLIGIKATQAEMSKRDKKETQLIISFIKVTTV